VAYRFPEDVRLKYVSTGSRQICMGSSFVEPVLALLAYLAKIQDLLGVSGDIGEIGVHHGLFFVGLAHLARTSDKLWAFDVFEKQVLNVDGSGLGSLNAFLNACTSNGIKEEYLNIVQGSSTDLSWVDATFRIFSVDGGHTREITFNDLSFAACHLARGGIIVLDDVTNFQWGGVIDGFFSWLHYFAVAFAPIFVGFNKVLLVQASYHDLYYNFLQLFAQESALSLSLEPASNANIHKSKDSGTNLFLWNGYQYVSESFVDDGNRTISQMKWKMQVCENYCNKY